MRIFSATLRNYRLHRELKVDFDRMLTLIGGPNETGKSTLIEAVHRALFLKAKGNTEYHRAMNSTLHNDHPEVELAFEAGGNTYVLKKRFGPSGTVTLAPSNSAPLQGDAADTEVARILGVETGLAGKGLKLQWAHLWVWQGESGDDPSTHATAQQGGLLRRLQQMGGAAALQSELDARTAKHFAKAVDEIYTSASKPKADSELKRAEVALGCANNELGRARDRVQKLDSSAADLENATQNLHAASASLAELEKQKAETESKVERLVELRRQETEQCHAARTASERHDALDFSNRQIVGLRLENSKLESALRPQQEGVSQMVAASDKAKKQLSTAEQAHRTAAEVVRAARLRYELARSHALLFEKAEVHRRLSEKDGKVSLRRKNLADLEEQLAKLPRVDKAKLNKLQKLEFECSKTNAALQAMAAGLEVIAADQPVMAGDQSLPVGQKQILTEDTEVAVGSTIRLRIQPGGGTSLAEARQTEREARASLQAALDAVALQSVHEAAEAHTRREDTAYRIKAIQAELQGMGAENLSEDLKNALSELIEARAKVESLIALVSGAKSPDDKAAAKALMEELERALNDTEVQEGAAKAAYEHLVKTLESAEEALRVQRAELEQQELRLNGLKAQLDLLVKSHGDDMTRGQTLFKYQAAMVAAQDMLKTTTEAIAALQPSLLEGDRHRIKRAIEQKIAERNDAHIQIAVAQAALHSDGNEDPRATLATAEARTRSASQYWNSVRRKAEALALLDQLFQEEQRTLANQFTQPLAETISGYLACIFGTHARAQVSLENNAFTGLRLSRSEFAGAVFDFETLSGGAKEQTAAAVRLAMAEVLAADYGGCLPVVFDDAFTNSDPERINSV